jgi:hypothetical protein
VQECLRVSSSQPGGHSFRPSGPKQLSCQLSESVGPNRSRTGRSADQVVGRPAASLASMFWRKSANPRNAWKIGLPERGEVTQRGSARDENRHVETTGNDPAIPSESAGSREPATNRQVVRRAAAGDTPSWDRRPRRLRRLPSRRNRTAPAALAGPPIRLVQGDGQRDRAGGRLCTDSGFVDEHPNARRIRSRRGRDRSGGRRRRVGLRDREPAVLRCRHRPPAACLRLRSPRVRAHPSDRPPEPARKRGAQYSRVGSEPDIPPRMRVERRRRGGSPGPIRVRGPKMETASLSPSRRDRSASRNPRRAPASAGRRLHP